MTTRPRTSTSDILAEFTSTFYQDHSQTNLDDQLYKLGMNGIDAAMLSANTYGVLKETAIECAIAIHNALPQPNQATKFETWPITKQINWLNEIAIDDPYAAKILEWSHHFI